MMKILASIFIILNYLLNLSLKIISLIKKKEHIKNNVLSKTGFIISFLAFLLMVYGILYGRLDYRVRYETIYLPNLPSSFEGLKIGQISDIHTGSFFRNREILKGVKLLLEDKPDIIFFTGDLVNFHSSEALKFKKSLSMIKAPMGVFSILGNHDYGDYTAWKTPKDKADDLNNLINFQKNIGWNLLIDENRILTRNNQSIAILGIQNWSAISRFPKRGILAKAHYGIEKIPVKLLLSHDPTNWDAQVRKNYKDIDIMFSGHTHAFQAGIEFGNFKWSPCQYLYNEWDGLYKKGNQYLMINRGFGYIGFPGRIGMPPIISIITLRKGKH
ncbi:MAG: metallophosphoesterase [Bacteroidota bacterium]|nr:metallophosphoesterase [Bacteroidota bacterium]